MGSREIQQMTLPFLHHRWLWIKKWGKNVRGHRSLHDLLTRSPICFSFMPAYPHPHYSWIWHKGYFPGAAWIRELNIESSEKLRYGRKLVQVCWYQGQKKTLGTFNSLIHVHTVFLPGTLMSQVPPQPLKAGRMEQFGTLALPAPGGFGSEECYAQLCGRDPHMPLHSLIRSYCSS